jgi:hypothetical protein
LIRALGQRVEDGSTECLSILLKEASHVVVDLPGKVLDTEFTVARLL